MFESRAWKAGYVAVAGLDEVGRGALAGPVYVAAVVFPVGCDLEGLRDSKLLSAAQREDLAERVRDAAQGIALARSEPEVVDRVNVLQATLLAMSQAIGALEPSPDYLLVDALRLPGSLVPQRCLVRGDGVSASIAAASILAKVERDRVMVEFAKAYPYYDFGENKGYGTRAHLDALKRLGPSPIHRRSFQRVAAPSGPQLF